MLGVIKEHQRYTLGKCYHNNCILSATSLDSTGPFSRGSVQNDKWKKHHIFTDTVFETMHT